MAKELSKEMTHHPQFVPLFPRRYIYERYAHARTLTRIGANFVWENDFIMIKPTKSKLVYPKGYVLTLCTAVPRIR